MLSQFVSAVFIGCLISVSTAHGKDTPFYYDYFELRGGTSHFYQKCENQNKARVAFLGGSITQMNGWRNLVMKDLETRFPKVSFDFIQAGVASMGSTPGAFRLERDVFSEGPVDLLFVEAAVNDSTNYRTEIEQIRGMEGIVRHAKIKNPDIDIIVMHFVDPEKLKVYRQGKVPDVIANHEKIASHYDVPSLNLALEVKERIDVGEFSWAKDFKNLHPAPFGHELYARSIARLLDESWELRKNRSNAKAFPDTPIDPYSYINGNVFDIKKAQIQSGFRFIEKWQPKDKKGTRPGFANVRMFVGTEPGDSFTYTFIGSAIGLWVAAGPDAGVFEYRLDGHAPRVVDTYTPWSGSLHLPWAFMLETELENREHTLTVRILEQSNPKSFGTALRIAHFLVNQ
jgi:lysophospholipase L1-like esterase